MRLSLYINTASNNLLSSLTGSAAVAPQSLPFFCGDVIQLQVYLMEPLQTTQPSVPQYSIINTAGLALEMYITNGLDSNSPDYIAYTWQVTWSTDPNNQYFYANLDLTQEALVTLLANSTNATAYLVVGYVAGGYDTTVLYVTITLQPGIPNAVGPLPAGLTPLSVQAAAGMFVPISGVPPIPGGGPNGAGFFLTSPNGHKLYVCAVDNADGSGPAQLQVSPV